MTQLITPSSLKYFLSLASIKPLFLGFPSSSWIIYHQLALLILIFLPNFFQLRPRAGPCYSSLLCLLTPLVTSFSFMILIITTYTLSIPKFISQPRYSLPSSDSCNQLSTQFSTWIFSIQLQFNMIKSKLLIFSTQTCSIFF